MDEPCAEPDPRQTDTARPRRRSRAVPSPFVPSPVAVGIASLCRRAGRGLSGRTRLGRLPPLAALAAVASVGLWLPGPAPRVAVEAPEADRTRVREGARDDATADVTADASERVTADVTVDAAASGSAEEAANDAANEAANEAVAMRGPSGSPSKDEKSSAPSVPAASLGPRVDTVSGEASAVPVERHERVVREKRELEARVAALEAETTALESEMLALDLQLVSIDSAARDAGVDLDVLEGDGDIAGVAGDAPEPDAPAPRAPVELGNSTLVPAPLSGLEEGAVARNDGPEVRSSAPDAWSDAPDILDPLSEPFLPGAAAGTFVGGTAETASAAPLVDDGGAGERAAASADVGLPVERLVVAEVPYGSAADDAGLLPGDILVAIDDGPVTTLADIDAYAASGDPAPMHEIELLRGGRRQWLALADSPARLSLVTRSVDPARLTVD